MDVVARWLVALGSVGVPTEIVICKETSGTNRKKRITNWFESCPINTRELLCEVDVIPIILKWSTALSCGWWMYVQSNSRRVITFNDTIIFPRSNFKFKFCPPHRAHSQFILIQFNRRPIFDSIEQHSSHLWFIFQNVKCELQSQGERAREKSYP